MALAYSAYDRLLGLEPLDWEGRLEESPTPLQEVREIALDFPIEQVVGSYEHPAYGVLTVRATGDKLAMQFRTFVSRWSIRATGGFSARNPLPTGRRRSRFGSRSRRRASR